MFGRRASSVVGRHSVVKGSLDCGEDDGRVEGRLDGTIRSAATVVIAEHGRVEGDVIAKNVVVGGLVQGTVTAEDRLQLSSTGQILGDAIYGTLEVERGGVVKGRTMTITTRPPSTHPSVDDTLRLPAGGDAKRITADWGTAESLEPNSDLGIDSGAAGEPSDGDHDSVPPSG